MPIDTYLPDGTQCDDLDRWSEAHKKAHRVGKTTVGPWEVSTVFLGIDHRFEPDDKGPILWETMVFGPHTYYQDRYRSLEAAQEGHKRVVEWLTKNGWRLRLAGRIHDVAKRISDRLGQRIAGEWVQVYPD